MLKSSQLKDNPSLYIFLPILYEVWADAVLTPREVKIVEDVIDGQHWITAAERKFLFEHLDPSHPPTPMNSRIG